ncbi:O-antigen ligase family protein [Kiloniella sp. b19]|uniref:O-antigen ligase family protein n=1 Tax=Kiloniella sp. GXU_MW_B19 TaxID=3141326 RepID=UPI0031DE2A9D
MLEQNDNKRLRQTLVACFACTVLLAVWYLGKNPLIPLALAMMPLGLLLVLSNSFLVILGFIIFSFFRIHEVFPLLMPFKLPLLLALASFAALGWNLFSGRATLYWNRELGLFALFVLVVFSGCLLATNRGIAFSAFNGTFIKIAIIVIAICWMTKGIEEFKLAARLICIAGLIVGLVTLFNAANGIGLVEGTRVTIGRDIGSMLGDPNDLALVLLFPAAFGLSLLLSAKISRTERVLGFFTIILMFLAILATQSRGGLLGIMAVCGVFAWYKVPSKSLLIVGGVVAMLALFALAGIDERASGGAHEEGIDESAMGRLHAWKAAFKMALHNPLTGIGIDNFYYNYFDYSDFWDGKNHAVHSTWFGVLAETGFLGLGLFLSLVFLSVRNMMRCVRITQAEHSDPYLSAMSMALLAGLAGFCASGTFLTMGFTWPFYIMFGLSIALRQIVSQNEKQKTATEQTSPLTI